MVASFYCNISAEWNWGNDCKIDQVYNKIFKSTYFGSHSLMGIQIIVVIMVSV